VPAVADAGRFERVARHILADILAVGSVATAGPALDPEREAELLASVEARLRALFQHHGHEDDAEIRARFRREHPELFTGDAAARHRAASSRGPQEPRP
jgi:hypothetical protein